MIEICEICEDEMIATFLTEANSVRFGGCIRDQIIARGLDMRIIEKPDLSNPEENRSRKAILSFCRAGLLSGFPTSVLWKRALLERKDFASLRYIKQEAWKQLAGDSRLVTNGASAKRNGATLPGISEVEFEGTLCAIREKAKFPEIILVTADEGQTLVILEGHKRATAYLFDENSMPSDLTIIVGFSTEFVSWPFY